MVHVWCISISMSTTNRPDYRTKLDLLTERRVLVNEQRFERDKTARAMLQYQIDAIDGLLKAVA